MSIRVSVSSKGTVLNSKRRRYLEAIFPAWRECSPGRPGFTTMEYFQSRSIQLHTRSIDAQCSITGAPWDLTDLDTLKGRDPKRFLKVIACPINLERIMNDFDKELYRQGVVN